MPAISRTQFSQQMVAQLRLLNPNYSAEIGTPERLIIDTVAQALTDSQIDLIGLENALNIDTKFGTNLDNFVQLFGFARQVATAASGFVAFSRNAPSTLPITVPQGTILQSTTVGPDGALLQFATGASVTLPPNELQTTPVPILALTTGSASNVEANTITIIVGEPVPGITGVTNPNPTTRGADQESDNSLKVRFKNTVFRNLAGTEDQYLALAVATALSTKANVIGPVSQYQEYIQVPDVNDATATGEKPRVYPGTPTEIVARGTATGTELKVPTAGLPKGEFNLTIFKGEPDPEENKGKGEVTGTNVVFLKSMEKSIPIESGGAKEYRNSVCLLGNSVSVSASEWTTALSTIPYAKNIWTTKPVFITKTQNSLTNYFFRQGVDFNFNFPAKLQGDALRELIQGVGNDPRTTIGTTQPNVTFTNVYSGTNESVQAVREKDIILLEYSYTSTASRNNLERNITNAVDVFVDGSNPTPSTTIFSKPAAAPSVFVINPASMYYIDNYRRDGEPTKRPLEGNYLIPLFQEPVTGLPKEIKIIEKVKVKKGESEEEITALVSYYLGTHYWLVHDVSTYEGTIRARDGIEWSALVKGDVNGEKKPKPEPLSLPPAPTDPSLESAYIFAYEGEKFQNIPEGTLVEVENYFYDKNITDLQAALESARQITTDVLAHRAKARYFKLDITVIYEPSATPAIVNNNIQSVLSQFLKSQYFGAAINLSDLLQEVHSVSGVNNVRWTADIPNPSNEIRIFETDINGQPLLGATVDRLVAGSASTFEVQELMLAGRPTNGNFSLVYEIEGKEKKITMNIEKLNSQELLGPTFSATYVQEEYEKGLGKAVSVENTTIGIIKSFRVTFGTKATFPLPSVKNENILKGEEYVYDFDFFLRDNELPLLPTGKQSADTVPGLVIRPRAQGTWERR